jgi:ubiquinone/menaquinone biosynthesis C-methylase UbiE
VTLISPIEGHRLWAPAYDSGPNPLLALEARLLAPLLGPVTGLRVVDLACGTGRWTERLTELGARVVGIDLCDAMLIRAAAKPVLAGRLALADASALPLRSESSSLTICSFAIGYFPVLEDAFEEMARITRRGGTVVICDLHPSAAAAGWDRSFRAAGTVYRLQHFTRSREQVCAEARQAGLQTELLVDGHFGEPERNIFQAGGKESIFAEVATVPAVWIGIWKRP